MKKVIMRLAGMSGRYKNFVLILLLMYCCNCSAQTSDASITPPDSEFVMHVERQKGEVSIALEFSGNTPFDYVLIERKADFDGNFSMCKYVSYEEIKGYGGKVVEKDNYPLPATSDVLYRLRIVNVNQSMSIYPPVRLAAIARYTRAVAIMQ